MKKILSFAVAALTAVTFLASCDKGTDLYKAIPKDASVVIKADLRKLAEKGAIGENKDLQAQLQEGINQLPASLQPKAKEIIEDPTKAGLALDKPVLAAVTGADCNGFVVAAAVDDKAKVDDLFKQIQKEEKTLKITEGDDVTTIEDNDAQIAYNSQLFVVTQKGGNAAELLKQDKDKSILSDSKYDKFVEAASDIDFIINYETLIGVAKKVGSQYAQAANLDATDKLTKGLYVLGGVTFNDKQVDVATEFFGNDEYIKLCKELEKKPSNDYIKYVAQDAYFIAQGGATNIDKIIPYLPKESLQQIDQILKSSGISAEQLLKSLDGDMLLAVAPNGSNPIPQVTLALGINDAKIWEAVKANIAVAGEMAQKKDENTFILKTKEIAGAEYTLSYENKTLLLKGEATPAKTFKDNAGYDAVKEGGVFIDIAAILSNNFVKQSAGAYADKFSSLTNLTIGGEGTKANIKLNLKEEGNALATLIKMAQK